MHRELVYSVIVTKLTMNITGDQEKVLALFNFLHSHLGDQSVSIYINEIYNLTKGVGSCDQQAATLVTLAGKLNLSGHLIGAPHHVATEIYINGKYRFFDPYKGIVFFNGNGELAAFNEIIANNGATMHSEQMDARSKYSSSVKDEYFRLFKEKTLFIDVKNRKIDELIILVIDIFYKLFGDTFLVLFQSTYFSLSKTNIFLKARYKQLTWRFQSALNDYNQILSNRESINVLHNYDSLFYGIQYRDLKKSVDSVIEYETAFFMGQTYWDMQAYRKCIDWLTALSKRFPSNSKWTNMIYFYLADSYEKLGDVDNALHYYSKIKDDTLTPGPVRYRKLQQTISKHSLLYSIGDGGVA